MKIFGSRVFAFILALCLFCAGLMIYQGATGSPSPIASALGTVVTPVQSALSGVIDGVKDFFGYFYRYEALKEENERLEEELSEYREMEREYLSAINENAQLRRMTGLVEKYSDFEFELCRVSSVYRGVAQTGMVLNKGSVSGIDKGDSVMTDSGLIGYVSAVGPNYSEVVTLLDISFKSEARISRTGETVIAEGDFELSGDGCFKLSYLPRDCDIQPYDIVETSGYGGIYPSGVMLGRVMEIKLDTSGLMSYAVVRPVDDIAQLKWVYVVKDFEVVE